MFDLFFLQCKTEIYTSRMRDQPWYSMVLLVILLAAGLGSIFFSFFLRSTIGFLICYSLVVIVAIIVAVLDRRRNKQVNAIAEDYRTQTIGKLEAQLKSQPYRLYHTAGLDWLISCCDQHIQPPQKPSPTSVLPYVFSIFTLAYGLVLKEMTTDDVVLTTLSLLALLLVWEIANRTVVAAWVDWYRNPNKLVYQRLKRDLEYIRVHLPNSKTPNTVPPTRDQASPNPRGPTKGKASPNPRERTKGRTRTNLVNNWVCNAKHPPPVPR